MTSALFKYNNSVTSHLQACKNKRIDVCGGFSSFYENSGSVYCLPSRCNCDVPSGLNVTGTSMLHPWL